MSIQTPSCALSFSGGKDSMLALDRATRQGWPVKYLVNLYDEASQRVRFHGIRKELIQAQADALGLPLLAYPTQPETFEQIFLAALKDVRARGVDTIIFGNIHLADVRAWYEERTTGHGLHHLEPLWGEAPATLVHEVIERGYHAILTSIELARSRVEWLGQPLTPALVSAFEQAGIDVCGERGEYHTFVTDGPLFQHPIPISLGQAANMPGFALIEIAQAPAMPIEVQDTKSREKTL
jgi:diphthine-ammonia ligase